ncbi:DgyrCDS8225 [Dimorphilus gyrociliatus]|uniref:DgyrCDS8225 n=1 Tax=Dimorphilus gyrociliatus TaxID=2664684 RepID=A0A7I8VV49_9ANNE|nr:DgyrCDS8225 [Dimorphilus gyrociliatus]
MQPRKKSAKPKLLNDRRSSGTNYSRLTNLHKYISNGDKESLEKQLEVEGTKNLNTQDKTGKSPLLYSILGEYTDCFEVLLNYDPDITIKDSTGKTALHYAVQKGNIAFIEMLLQRGANIMDKDNEGLNSLLLSSRYSNAKCLNLMLKHLNARDLEDTDKQKKTALHWSCSSGHLEIVKILINNGMKASTQDITGKTSLHWAAMGKGQFATDCISYLLEVEPSIINVQDYEGRTSLHQAAAYGDENAVRTLASNEKCSVSCVDSLFRTPLHWASVLGRQEIVKILMEFKIDCGMTDSNGATALHYSAKNNYSGCVKALLGGISQVIRDESDGEGRTALIWASGHGADDALSLLVEAGCNVHHVDNHGATALHAAAQNGHASTVKLLLAYGSDKNVMDQLSLTPLFRACEYGHEEVLRILYQSGVDLETRDADGRSALHWASLSGHAHICSMLIKFGLNPDVYDRSGRTPLQCASYSGHVNCMIILIEYKADPNWQDNEGMTALHWACSKGHLESAKILIQFQASLNNMELTEDKYTPLDYALLENHQKVAQFLIEQGALSIRGIQESAATKIQSVIRGLAVRRELEEKRNLLRKKHQKQLEEKRKQSRHIRAEKLPVTKKNSKNSKQIDRSETNEMILERKNSYRRNISREKERKKLIKAKITAAIVIQRAWRRYKSSGFVRNGNDDMIRELAALTIQLAWRKYYRRRVLSKLNELTSKKRKVLQIWDPAVISAKQEALVRHIYGKKLI